MNAISNFVASVWTAVLGFVFIPIFVRYLGVEAYGLIGLYAALQAVFALLDFGLGLTVNREMARLATSPGGMERQRNLLRTMEVLYWIVAMVIGAIVALAAELIANHWLHDSTLPVSVVVVSIRVMGLIVALQFPLGLYRGVLMGLQRQVALNAILVSVGTLRSVGAAVLVMLWWPSVIVFFGWQLLVVSMQTLATIRIAWSALPRSTVIPRFEIGLIRDIWRYSAAVGANAVIGVLLTQLDKVLLSRTVSLETLGYYSIASSVASIPWMVSIPINSAFFPRFTQAVESESEAAVANLYHRATQLVAALLLPVCATLVVFSGEFVLAWTGSSETARATAIIVSLLLSGTMVNGFTSIAGTFRAAAGWPQLTAYANGIAAIVLVPTLVYSTTRYGAIGAAVVWLVLNCLHMSCTIPLMHRRLLRAEMWKWYVYDFGLPLAVVLSLSCTLKLLLPETTSRPALLVYLGLAWFFSSIGCVTVLPMIRREAIGAVRRFVRTFETRGR